MNSLLPEFGGVLYERLRLELTKKAPAPTQMCHAGFALVKTSICEQCLRPIIYGATLQHNETPDIFVPLSLHKNSGERDGLLACGMTRFFVFLFAVWIATLPAVVRNDETIK